MKLGFIAGFLTTCVAWAGPQVVVEPQALDLGTVREGEIVDVPFTVSNAGDESFAIRAVRFSCGCLSIRELTDAEKLVEPGESLTLPIVYDTTGYSGDRAANVVIMTDAPEQPSLMTDVKLFIETPVRVRPRGLDLGRQLRGAALPVDVTISSGIEDAPIRVLEAQIPSPLFEFEPTITLEEEETRISGTVTLVEDAPLGDVRSVLIATVEQDDRSFPVQVPIGVQILGDMVVSPPMVLHVNRPIAAGAALSELRVVSTTADAPVEILAVRVDGPLAPADVSEEGDGIFRLPLTIAADAPAGHHVASIDIFTTSKDTPVVTVPVYLWIASALRAQPQSVLLEPGDGPAEIALFGDGDVRIETIDQDAVEVNVEILQGNGSTPTRLSISPNDDTTDSTPQVGYLNVVSENGAAVRIPVIVR